MSPWAWLALLLAVYGGLVVVSAAFCGLAHVLGTLFACLTTGKGLKIRLHKR